MVKRVRVKVEHKPEPLKPLKEPIRLMIDSGVFSASSRGMTLDLKQYIAFIKRYEKLVFSYVTMDQIPARHGGVPTKKEVDESAAAGYRNHQIMKDAGLKPIPVFHQGESFKWLERYLRDGETYIGIATTKDLPGDLSEYHSAWLDQMFSILTNAKGVPYVKTHGFGITKLDFMQRYPWFTCDSTTWALAAGFGMIYVPRYLSGGFDYSKPPTRVIMSDVTQMSWSAHQRRYDNMGPTERSHVDKYIAHLGLTVKEVVHTSQARRLANVKYYNEFCALQPVTPFDDAHRVPTAFADLKLRAPRIHAHKAVMFATALYQNRGVQLTLIEGNATTRLLSYFEIYKLMESDVERVDTMMQNYVKYGIDDPTFTRKVPRQHAKWGEHYASHRRLNIHKRIEGYNTDGTQQAD